MSCQHKTVSCENTTPDKDGLFHAICDDCQKSLICLSAMEWQVDCSWSIPSEFLPNPFGTCCRGVKRRVDAKKPRFHNEHVVGWDYTGTCTGCRQGHRWYDTIRDQQKLTEINRIK